jgi:hypothetical protein
MNNAVQARGQAEGTRSLSIGRHAIVAAGLGLAVSALLVDCREPRHTEALKMGRNADAFDFLLGEWEIAMLTMPEGSTVGRRAILNVHRILDGAALLDEIRHVDQGGHVNFRGATFRTYLPDRDRWYVLWMMANVEGYSELDAQVIDGEVHTTGKGRDPGGELVERGRYYDISGDGYSFTLDRSYDSGKTWIRLFVSFRATRRSSAE